MSLQIILIGIAAAGFIIGAVELSRLDRRTAGSLILTAIGFIYVGFAGDDRTLLLINCTQAAVVWLLAYGGLRKNPLWIPLGLMLHAAWDFGYLYLVDGVVIPEGYELFCVVVDFGLAGWLYLRFSGKSN